MLDERRMENPYTQRYVMHHAERRGFLLSAVFRSDVYSIVNQCLLQTCRNVPRQDVERTDTPMAKVMSARHGAPPKNLEQKLA